MGVFGRPKTVLFLDTLPVMTESLASPDYVLLETLPFLFPLPFFFFFFLT